MKIQIKRDGKFIDVDKIKISINEVDFRISLNVFGDLVVNKWQNGEETGDMLILPSVSNEIRIR